jgi:NAD(P)-dependent dehydrogenase (short-subunit alcohol dehydrogenase family)
VTDPEQIRRAAEAVDSLDVLVNNAGVAIYDDLSDRSVLLITHRPEGLDRMDEVVVLDAA